jgi:hypothetical protein
MNNDMSDMSRSSSSGVDEDVSLFVGIYFLTLLELLLPRLGFISGGGGGGGCCHHD